MHIAQGMNSNGPLGPDSLDGGNSRAMPLGVSSQEIGGHEGIGGQGLGERGKTGEKQEKNNDDETSAASTVMHV